MDKNSGTLFPQPLITIIIPVYNAESYLNICLDSVIHQTYTNLEILIVDDGSTDLSSKICEKYAQNDSRIRLFHQENKGQAVARNHAIEMATGEYYFFVDSDDLIASHCIMRLANIMEHSRADIVTCLDMKFKDGKKVKEKKIKNGSVEIFTKEKAIEELCYQRFFSQGPWCKLIKREIVWKCLFPEKTGYEDMAVIYQYFSNAQEIYFVPEYLYFYRQHRNSIMHEKFSYKKLDRLTVTEKMKRDLEKYGPQLSKAINNRFFLSNLQVLMELPKSKDFENTYEIVSDNIRQYRGEVVLDRKSKPSIRLIACISYLGIKILRILGYKYHSLINYI